MRLPLRHLVATVFFTAFFWSVGSADTILENEVTGVLTEVGSPYIVTESIFVPAESVLKVEGGVEINFQPGTQIEIFGTLNILGTINEPVVFQADTSGPWKGISISGKDADGGFIRYAEISGCTNGLIFSDVSFSLELSTIEALESAILIDADSYVTINYVLAELQADKLSATALKVKDSYIEARDCYFRVNADVTHPGSNNLQAVIFDDAEGLFTDNHLRVESTSAIDGIFVNDCSGLGVDHCSVKIGSDGVNRAHRSSALRVQGSGSIVFDHMSIDLAVQQANVASLHVLENCTAHLNNSIVANTVSNDYALAFYIPENEYRAHIQAQFNCFYGVYVSGNTEYILCEVPLIIHLFQNLGWVDVTSEDYHLEPSSLCIDAGNPFFEYDPDGTITDLGRFYYEQASDVTPGTGVTIPEKFALEAAYPNPFNSSIRFTLNVNNNRHIVVRIHDVLGREVSTLYSGPMQSGQHTFHWNGLSGFSPVASGTYFIRVNSESKVLTQRISLVR